LVVLVFSRLPGKSRIEKTAQQHPETAQDDGHMDALSTWLQDLGVEHYVSSFAENDVDLSRSQDAKGWQLRAATSLTRLWQGQGKRGEAYELLAPAYNWFTEGFDTRDLIQGKALLEELAR
jgi:predicted ATPase